VSQKKLLGHWDISLKMGQFQEKGDEWKPYTVAVEEIKHRRSKSFEDLNPHPHDCDNPHICR
jgi:hypothetical protein